VESKTARMKRSTDEGEKSFAPYSLGYSISSFWNKNRGQSNNYRLAPLDLLRGNILTCDFAATFASIAVKKIIQKKQSKLRRTSAQTISNSPPNLSFSFLPNPSYTITTNT